MSSLCWTRSMYQNTCIAGGAHFRAFGRSNITTTTTAFFHRAEKWLRLLNSASSCHVRCVSTVSTTPGCCRACIRSADGVLRMRCAAVTARAWGAPPAARTWPSTRTPGSTAYRPTSSSTTSWMSCPMMMTLIQLGNWTAPECVHRATRVAEPVASVENATSISVITASGRTRG